MAWRPDYLTVSQFKDAIDVPDTADDTQIGFAISAASRQIDAYCNRQFGNLSAAAPRYYSAYYDNNRHRYVAIIDDLQTTTDLAVTTNNQESGAYDNALVLDTDFRLEPLNSAANGKPWTMITGLSGATYGLSTREDSIRITARWGWTAVPAEVTQACLIQAVRLFSRPKAPFGVLGSPDMGGAEMRLLAKLDPDVQQLLRGLVRYWGAR